MEDKVLVGVMVALWVGGLLALFLVYATVRGLVGRVARAVRYGRFGAFFWMNQEERDAEAVDRPFRRLSSRLVSAMARLKHWEDVLLLSYQGQATPEAAAKARKEILRWEARVNVLQDRLAVMRGTYIAPERREPVVTEVPDAAFAEIAVMVAAGQHAPRPSVAPAGQAGDGFSEARPEPEPEFEEGDEDGDDGEDGDFGQASGARGMIAHPDDQGEVPFKPLSASTVSALDDISFGDGPAGSMFGGGLEDLSDDLEDLMGDDGPEDALDTVDLSKKPAPEAPAASGPAVPDILPFHEAEALQRRLSSEEKKRRAVNSPRKGAKPRRRRTSLDSGTAES